MDKVSSWLQSIHPISPNDSDDGGYCSDSGMASISSFSIDSQRSSPPTSPAQLLNEMENFDPPIILDPQDLPAAAMELRSRISTNFGTDIIPKELQQCITTEAPIQALDIRPEAYNVSDVPPLKTLQIWSFVKEIFEEAQLCWLRAKDECSWTELVVSRILRQGFFGNTVLVLNIQNHSVDTNVLPKLPPGIKTPKRSEYAFGFSDRNRIVKEILQKIKGIDPKIAPSVTTTPSSRNMLLFGALEAKPGSGDFVEAFTQMCLFLSAVHQKYIFLTGEAPPPLPGIIVIGHEWAIYISWLHDLKVHIHGPIEVARASTRSYQGIFRILDLIGRLNSYAEDVLIPWLSEKF